MTPMLLKKSDTPEKVKEVVKGVHTLMELNDRINQVTRELEKQGELKRIEDILKSEEYAPALAVARTSPEKFEETMKYINALEEIGERINKARAEEARINSEIKTIKELMEKDENVNASAMAFRYNEVIRNLTHMMVSPDKAELSF